MNDRFKAIRRRGLSLIEMSVVIVLTAVLLSMAVTLLTSLLGIHRGSVERATMRSEMNRLTDTLRRDLRLATAVTQPNETTLVLELETEPVVQYVLDESVCRRSRAASANRAREHERFAVGPALRWQVDQPPAIDGGGMSRTVAIQWAPRQPHAPPPPPLQIVAAQTLR